MIGPGGVTPPPCPAIAAQTLPERSPPNWMPVWRKGARHRRPGAVPDCNAIGNGSKGLPRRTLFDWARSQNIIGRNATMKITKVALCLAAVLALPLAARADENADKLAVATKLTEKTVLKNLDTGFGGALEKTVSTMPDDKAEKVRKEARAEFDKQRKELLEGLSKQYADKFSLDELKELDKIYDDKTYQKFQAVNADPKSEVNLLSQAVVTRLLNMLTLAAASDQTGGAPGGLPGGMPMPAK
ncbi:hypothetical protein GCM10008965_36530 [Methylorubrum aminovorans]|nr:hypothetical protein GCM10025880_03210 [Methylorubrum aminovorans]